MFVSNVLPLSLFFFPLALAAQEAALPVYLAGRTLDSIRIDGKLDEFSWVAAPRAGSFRDIHRPGKPKFPAQAAIVWDDANLYIAFACADAAPWGRMKNRDDHLWEEEVVEVFLDPDGDGLNYAELEVSPNNVVVDLLIPRPRASTPDAIRWDIDGLRTAAGRFPSGWTAEISIPWKSLAAAGVTAAPHPGDRWRVGLYHIKRPGGPPKAAEIDALVEEEKTASSARKAEIGKRLLDLRSNDEFTAWSPTHSERGFHDPERFGIVQFVETP